MPLTANQTFELQDRIERRHAALLAELSQDAAKLHEDSERLDGEKAPMLVVELDAAEVRRDAAELRALELARQRVAIGEYGVCADCGSDIGYERLLAFPAAPRCLDCQRRHEKTYNGSPTPAL